MAQHYPQLGLRYYLARLYKNLIGSSAPTLAPFNLICYNQMNLSFIFFPNLNTNNFQLLGLISKAVTLIFHIKYQHCHHLTQPVYSHLWVTAGVICIPGVGSLVLIPIFK